MELYVKLGWPEYQAYMDIEGFDNNSSYDPIEDCYFIEKNWYNANTN